MRATGTLKPRPINAISSVAWPVFSSNQTGRGGGVSRGVDAGAAARVNATFRNKTREIRLRIL
jgi:hypothetical protein